MDIAAALQSLLAAADDGRLERMCRRHAVRLVTVFGSAARDAALARDLDVAVLFGPREPLAPLHVVNALIDLAGTEAVDLMVLNDAEPVARFNGLVGALPLYQDEPGRWASVQMAAAGEVYDTEWLRRLDLDRMTQ